MDLKFKKTFLLPSTDNNSLPIHSYTWSYRIFVRQVYQVNHIVSNKLVTVIKCLPLYSVILNFPVMEIYNSNGFKL